ncbi:precorrin-6y C5,15-methyltransferase (decarboxylating) subunit CbiE [Clostridium sp. KNHs214]|uniref:precorrin-6y C5,15-methyltransferase (decarboxylating) subunit CbiE n=1 Tax=Clostridium sp. KNHs214 TaxID=1540257 RepID=UPI000551E45B|nr:precorrin-6y C5,15-methyltransferase (decarboxylating) subunit CbiE [Clostridium sp. KNHs214]
MIYIVGIGPGHKNYIIPKAIDVMEKANIVLGFKRAIESLYFIENKKVVVTTLKEIIEYINNNCDEDIAVAASGDPCYYGITNYIKNNYRGKIEIIPGISSFQYMMSKIAVPWNEAFTGSMHGREEEFVDVVRSHKISIWLTDKTNAPNVLCERLLKARLNLIEESEKASETAGTGIIKYTEASKTVGTGVMKYTQSGKTAEKGLEIKIYVGENLSYENEKISSGTLSEMARKSYSDLCVVVIEKCIL